MKPEILNEKSIVWRPVPGYEDLYQVNEEGLVMSLHKRNYGIILKSRIDRAGYQTVRLSKAGVTKTHFLHRITATAFVSNPEGKDEVNHKNGVKVDCRAVNLEWVSHSFNMIHAYQNNLIKSRSKPVVNSANGKVFSSLKEAAGYYGVNIKTLRNQVNGNRRSGLTSLRYVTNMTPIPIFQNPSHSSSGLRPREMQ